MVSKTCGSALKMVVVPVRSPCGPDLADGRRGHAARVLLGPDEAVSGRLDAQRLRQRVDDADADAVEAARDLVAAAAELAAGVEDRVDDLEGVLAAGVAADRNASTVVGDADGAVLEDADLDVGGVARHRFVDRVVDDFPDQVVQAPHVGRADVHARSSPDGVEAFEDLDALGVVVARGRLAGTASRPAPQSAPAVEPSADPLAARGRSWVKRLLRSGGRRGARTPRRCSTRSRCVRPSCDRARRTLVPSARRRSSSRRSISASGSLAAAPVVRGPLAKPADQLLGLSDG